MALSGNKGEWSEIYTLFKLLGEGKVHAGDANMNKLDIYYPILNIIRQESKRYEYKPNKEQHIVIIDENGTEYARISMDRFMQESKSLLKEIKDATERSFSVHSAENFMAEIGCEKIKEPPRPGHNKSDIQIMIHDMRTNMTPTLGFSIKSQLGSPSTLFNAGEASNILFKIVGKRITDEELSKINSLGGLAKIMEGLYDKGYTLSFDKVEHPVFYNNLVFVDSCMPQFIAACLLAFNKPGNSSSVNDIVESVSDENPLGYTGNNAQAFYQHKMKSLLIDAALGMTAASEWNGYYDANGGYIVVRKDGEIVCYHFYNRNDVEDYLYSNTKFENASRDRYNFGKLFRGEDGEVYINLNLQIRFKK